jgi:hypothetical protein
VPPIKAELINIPITLPGPVLISWVVELLVTAGVVASVEADDDIDVPELLLLDVLLWVFDFVDDGLGVVVAIFEGHFLEVDLLVQVD